MCRKCRALQLLEFFVLCRSSVSLMNIRVRFWGAFWEVALIFERPLLSIHGAQHCWRAASVVLKFFFLFDWEEWCGERDFLMGVQLGRLCVVYQVKYTEIRLTMNIDFTDFDGIWGDCSSLYYNCNCFVWQTQVQHSPRARRGRV